MRFSVIIPTYLDWDRLSISLEALKKQQFPKEDFEVIVINNHSEHEEGKLPKGSNIKILHEPKPGSYAARNLGIRKAKGEILAFTDSDCLPDNLWLSKADAFFKENPHLQRGAGKIELLYSNLENNPVELYESVYAFNQQENAKKGLSVTANFFAFSKLFTEIGYFDDSLFSGGDYQWNRLATSSNIPMGYIANAKVFHPARYSFEQLQKKAIRVAAGEFGENLKKISKVNSCLLLVKDCRPPVFEIKKISKEKHLSFLQKTKVWCVRYWFRVTKAKEQFKLRTTNKSPENI
jgi:glycosyltransferase involved in cell wall biosynthesis